MINRDSQHVYGEVDALVTLLNYQTTNSGCCKVVLHPHVGQRGVPGESVRQGARERAARRHRERRARHSRERSGGLNSTFSSFCHDA